MVLFTKMEGLATTVHSGTEKATDPIGIPMNPWRDVVSKQVAKNLEEDLEEEEIDTDYDAGPHDEEPQNSIIEEDIVRIPEGSPSFSTVMNELHINLTNLPLHDDHKATISPLARSNHDEIFHQETSSPESKSPPSAESPGLKKKRVFSASVPQRNRSQSWNHRNKMAAERRKQMSLTVPHSYEPSSTHSSPLIIRKSKSKAKSQPSTPKIIHLIPKYKFLTETVSVSHEDLVKEQEKEKLFAHGFVEAKSIFDSSSFHRFGDTPE